MNYLTMISAKFDKRKIPYPVYVDHVERSWRRSMALSAHSSQFEDFKNYKNDWASIPSDK